MALSKKIFILAFLITLLLLAIVILLGAMLNLNRKDYVTDQMSIIKDLNELQIYSLMTDVYGDKMACLAFQQKLAEWDDSLWDLGLKLDSYRVATEEFEKDTFYLDQKKKFNENEVLYLLFLTKVKKECSINQHIITFFYGNSKDCKKCDDQSFVLTDIKEEKKDRVAIFSLDTDLNITNIHILREYYNINKTDLPCIIVDEKATCGIQSKQEILQQICKKDPKFCEQ